MEPCHLEDELADDALRTLLDDACPMSSDLCKLAVTVLQRGNVQRSDELRCPDLACPTALALARHVPPRSFDLTPSLLDTCF